MQKQYLGKYKFNFNISNLTDPHIFQYYNFYILSKYLFRSQSVTDLLKLSISV